MENFKFRYKKKTLNSSIPDTFIKNNKKITDRKHIANGFNDFFVNVGPNLAKGIQTPSTNIRMQDYLGPANEHFMYLFEVEDSKIIEIVKHFKGKLSTDLNMDININMYIVKRVMTNIVKPFSQICHTSFISGIFPDNVKIAKVVPLYKADEKNLFTNYRPVSLLSQFSKILEKLSSKRLDKYIDKLIY